MSLALQSPSFAGCWSVSPSVTSSRRWERRRAPRHVCDPATRVAAFFWSEPCSARLRDLSTSGVAILVDAIVAPGDTLTVELHNSANGAWSCKVVRVAHTRPAPGGRWLVGGAFTEPLSNEELRPLLLRRHGRVA